MARPGRPSKDELALLVKLLGMLGSDNPHERAAFAAKASAWVRERGMTWEALLLPAAMAPARPPGGSRYGTAPGSGSRSSGPVDGSEPPPWVDLAQEMLDDHAGLLRGERERAFLESQIARAEQWGMSIRVSEKQEAWMRDILGRAGLTW